MAAAAAGADAAAEASYNPGNAILLQNCMKNIWNYKPCHFTVHHKTAYKSAEIMPNLAGWRAGLLVLLVLMLLFLLFYGLTTALPTPLIWPHIKTEA